jgi:hypothetical protein
MREHNYLSLQANIICILLALIGSTAVIKHPDWFGGTPETVASAETVSMPAPWGGFAPLLPSGDR